MQKIKDIVVGSKNWFHKQILIVKILTIILILGIGYFGYKKIFTSTDQTQYQTAKIEKGTLVASISASGTVSTSNVASITTEASGIVRKIYVKEGDKVSAGQKIAEVDLDLEGSQQYAQAYASYVSASNQLNSAKNNLRSATASLNKVYDDIKGHANDESFSMIETRIKSEVARDNAYDGVKGAQANFATAGFNLRASSQTITAHTVGTISSLTIAEGSSLGSQTTSTGTRTGQRVASITRTGNPIISVSISEIDVPKIKIGQKATITFDSITDKTFSGIVAAIDRVGSTTSNVTSYPALIKLDSSSDQILSNMAATANIITDVKNSVLTVPSTAISQQNGQTVVRVMKNGQITSVNVEIGSSSDSNTEVISGLNEGDEVVTTTTSTSSGSASQTRSVFSGGGFGGARFISR